MGIKKKKKTWISENGQMKFIELGFPIPIP